MVALAFRCKDSGVIDAYMVERKMEVAKFEREAHDFAEKHGLNSLFGINGYAGGRTVQGGTLASRDATAPHGWRFQYKNHSKHRVVPAKRVTAGMEIDREMRQLRLESIRYPGVTEVVFGPEHAIYPHVDKYVDTYYLTLSRVPMNLDDFDNDIWEPTKLSEYYRAKEEHDELNKENQ